MKMKNKDMVITSNRNRMEPSRTPRLPRGQHGFNVIGFLLTVALIVVIGLMVVPNLNLFMGIDKKIATANVETLNMRSAATSYALNTGKYPPNSDFLLSSEYIGQPRAFYTFDIGTGRIISASTDAIDHIPANPWTGIRWDYASGSWVKQ